MDKIIFASVVKQIFVIGKYGNPNISCFPVRRREII